MILRAKTKQLFQWDLTEQQSRNSKLNIDELEKGVSVLTSYPRRLVFELTNTCNLNCIMCGRNAADFHPTVFQMDWFRYFEPLFDTVEEVTLMGWGEPTVHPYFSEMLRILNQHTVRKYFCTNGMRLEELTPAIFENHVDLIGVSVDGATTETNDRIRRGSDLLKITHSLEQIEQYKRTNNLNYPYINFVFCAMASNLHELPDLVRLAAHIGLQEVKVVFLTVFDSVLLEESLWDRMDDVEAVFAEASQIGEVLGVLLKLPHLPGSDPAGEQSHKDCFVGWRDFFVGSDGFVRPCMSTAQKLFPLDINMPFMQMWNNPAIQKHRKSVNREMGMSLECKHCYQSSHCNWNRKESFIQIGNQFSPEWK